MTKKIYYLCFVSTGSSYTRCFDTKDERNAFKNRIGGHLRVVDEWENEILECINQVEEFEPLLNLIKRGVKHE